MYLILNIPQENRPRYIPIKLPNFSYTVGIILILPVTALITSPINTVVNVVMTEYHMKDTVYSLLIPSLIKENIRGKRLIPCYKAVGFY